VRAAETYLDFAKRMNAIETQSARFRPDLEIQLLGLANRYRVSRGLYKLTPNARLLQAARAHAMDMALNDFVGHRSSNNRDFDSRMRAFHPGQIFLPSMAENAARASNGEVQSLITQWIKSTSHRKALASRNYASVATAVAQIGKKLYAVQIFSGPVTKSSLNDNAVMQGIY
jgi:uncharacterized protein YkwD